MANRSRKARKRYRRLAEATAESPKRQGGEGEVFFVSRSALILLRRAINADWPVDPAMRKAITDALDPAFDRVDSLSARQAISLASTVLAMDEANIRLLKPHIQHLSTRRREL